MPEKQIELMPASGPKESRVINGKTWTGDPEALDALQQICGSYARRKASVMQPQLNAALDRIIAAVRSHADTGGGIALRRFLWSLWNGKHYLNLCTLGGALDAELGDDVAFVFTAYLRSAVSEDQIRHALTASGEFARWDVASKVTPDGRPVDYPPLPGSLREWVAATPPAKEKEVFPWP